MALGLGAMEWLPSQQCSFLHERAQGRLVSLGSNGRPVALTVATSLRCFLQCVLLLRARHQVAASGVITNSQRPRRLSPSEPPPSGCPLPRMDDRGLSLSRCGGHASSEGAIPIEASAAASRSSRVQKATMLHALPLRSRIPAAHVMSSQPTRVLAAVVVGPVLRVRPRKCRDRTRTCQCAAWLTHWYEPAACSRVAGFTSRGARARGSRRWSVRTGARARCVRRTACAQRARAAGSGFLHR
jgi:hypothetical protein